MWIAYCVVWICCTFLTYVSMEMTNSLLPLLIMLLPATTSFSRTITSDDKDE